MYKSVKAILFPCNDSLHYGLMEFDLFPIKPVSSVDERRGKVLANFCWGDTLEKEINRKMGERCTMKL